MVRTRFAPSPTGYLHIGGARTALFSWAFARHHGGQFVLRIEDTDVARSTPAAVQAILDGMAWLDLGHDEGPFYQMQRMERYKAVIQQMLEAGTAYRCYMSPAELDALRDEQRAKGEKPRYNGFWRPEAGKTLPTPPEGVAPVIRFKNPTAGVVAWEDQVKGRIEFANSELDDLIIARTDGTPTYNFCVVVDDWDMGITHVIRGDDHVNNTPRQINILQALGATVPQYAHLSMILGDDGQKLSKRHGAVSVTQYDDDGFLPEAVINYLARLGWSHGDDEIFSREQLVEWFDLDHITPSAAQFNTEKLLWLNQHYMKQLPASELAAKVAPRLAARGVSAEAIAAGPSLEAAVALYVDRCNTLNVLADAVAIFYQPVNPSPELIKKHLSDENVINALKDFLEKLSDDRLLNDAKTMPLLKADFPLGTLERMAVDADAFKEIMKDVLTAHSLKMPKLAMPLRVLLTGQEQTPSVDAVLALIGREQVLIRLAAR